MRRRATLSAIVLLCLPLAGCASSMTPTTPSTATTPATPTREPTPEPSGSLDAEQPESEPDVTTGRAEAQAACQIIHEAQSAAGPVIRQAAAEAEKAAELNPRWAELAAAMGAMRDYAAKYDGQQGIPEAEWRKEADDWQTTQDLCKDLIGTTLFIA